MGLLQKKRGGPSATAENFRLPALAQLYRSVLFKNGKDSLLPGVLSNSTVARCSLFIITEQERAYGTLSRRFHKLGILIWISKLYDCLRELSKSLLCAYTSDDWSAPLIGNISGKRFLTIYFLISFAWSVTEIKYSTTKTSFSTLQILMPNQGWIQYIFNNEKQYRTIRASINLAEQMHLWATCHVPVWPTNTGLFG